MAMDNLDRFPLNGTFELTARCNLQCKMCLIRIDHKRMAELGGSERTGDEWIQMAQEIRDAGTIGLLLTGGEPMLHPDFIKIYREIAQMGFLLTLYTNATLITPEIMEVLRDYPPHRIGVTVYGASPETYEKVTGDAKAYMKMRKGVEFLKELPSILTIRTTLIKDNVKDLDPIKEWAFSLGVDFNVSRVVTKPVRGGIADVEECRLTPEENTAMLEDRNKKHIVEPFHKFIQNNPEFISWTGENSTEKECESIDGENSTEEDIQTLYGCDAGMNSFCISWDGKMIGCQLLGDCWTHPFAIGFDKAWSDFPSIVKIPVMPKICRECNSACNACPATRLSETGLLNGWPMYLCKEGRLVESMEEILKEELHKIVSMKG